MTPRPRRETVIARIRGVALTVVGGEGAYDWYDFVLDRLGERYDVEEAGDIELRRR